jgi:hypothetical protein
VEARESVAQGYDPEEKRGADRKKLKTTSDHTLTNVAIAWYELKKDPVTTAYAETSGAH